MFNCANPPMLTLCLLGIPQVTWSGRPLAIPRRGVRALLYYLAARSEPVARDELLRVFWGDFPDEVARPRLRRMLSQLRQALIQSGAPAEILQTGADNVLLQPGVWWADVAAFDSDLSATRSAITPIAAIPAAERALAHYRGEFLGGFSLADCPDFENWLLVERERLTNRWLDMLLLLGMGYAQQGNYQQAKAQAERALQVDPLREEVHCLLMDCQAALGFWAAAVRQYELLRELLERELGVAPLPETEARYRKLMADRQSSARTAAPPPALPLNPPPLVGREAELKILYACWQQAAAGHGQAVVVSAVAGQGKTRLVHEFVSQVHACVTILAGACYPSTKSLPYYALAEALRPTLAARAGHTQHPWQKELSRLLPGTQTNLDDPAGQARLWESIARHLQGLAGSQPVCVVLNDLHWADTTTLSLLGYLTHRLASAPVMWIGTIRTEETAQFQSLRHELSREPNFKTIELAPLGESEIYRLIQNLAGLAEGGRPFSRRLFKETEGNPFFLIETLRHLQETSQLHIGAPGWQTIFDTITEACGELPLPETVRAAIQSRFAHLSPLAYQLLGAAAVIGRDFDLDTIHHVAGRSEAVVIRALEELTRAQIIVDCRQRFRFAHGKFQEVAYDDLNTARRRLLHKRAIDSLLRKARPERFAVELVYHAEQAGRWEQVVRFARWAAVGARSLYAYSDVADFETKALQAMEQLSPDPAAQIESLFNRENAYHILGKREEQAQDLRTVEQLIRVHRPLAHQVHLAFRRGRWLHAISRWAEALPHIEFAVASPAMSGDLACEAQLLLATCYGNLGQFETARCIARAALDQALRQGKLSAQAACAITLADLADLHQEFDQAQRWLEQARTRAAEAGDRPLQAQLFYLAARGSFQLGQFARARTLAAQGRALSHEVGHLEAEANCLRQFAAASARLRLAEEAIQAYRLASEIYRSLGQAYGVAAVELNLSALHLRLGDFERSREHSHTAFRLYTQLNYARGLGAAASNLGQALMWRGKGAEAEPWLAQAVAAAESLGLTHWLADALAYLGRSLLLQGRWAEAQALLQRSLDLIGEQYEVDKALHQAWLALACLRLDRLAEADRLSQAAVEQLPAQEGIDNPQQVLFVRALVRRTLGDAAGAQAHLAQAAAVVDSIAGAFTGETERERYRQSFVFNQLIQNAVNGCWPEPPRLL